MILEYFNLFVIFKSYTILFSVWFTKKNKQTRCMLPKLTSQNSKIYVDFTWAMITWICLIEIKQIVDTSIFCLFSKYLSHDCNTWYQLFQQKLCMNLIILNQFFKREFIMFLRKLITCMGMNFPVNNVNLN